MQGKYLNLIVLHELNESNKFSSHFEFTRDRDIVKFLFKLVCTIQA